MKVVSDFSPNISFRSSILNMPTVEVDDLQGDPKIWPFEINVLDFHHPIAYINASFQDKSKINIIIFLVPILKQMVFF